MTNNRNEYFRNYYRRNILKLKVYKREWNKRDREKRRKLLFKNKYKDYKLKLYWE